MAVDVLDSEHEELKALNLVLKFICNKSVKLTNVTSALYCLLISQRYQVNPFTKLCLKYLQEQVKTLKSTIEEIFMAFNSRFVQQMFWIL